MENKQTSLQVVTSSSLKLDFVNDAKKAKEFLADVIKHKGLKINSVEEGIAIYQMTQELGLGFFSAVNHMHVINGKVGIDIHIIKAKLLKAGSIIRWTKTKDYEPQYKYTDNSSEWVSNLKPTAFLKWLANDDPYYENAHYVFDTDSRKYADEHSKVPIFPVYYVADDKNRLRIAPFDYITEYKFEREQLFGIKKEPQLLTEYGKFSYREGVLIGKIKEGKDMDAEYFSSVWYKYPKLMVDHRAFTFGARAIADDLLMGCYETKELMDMENRDYLIDNEGNIIHKGSFTDSSTFKETSENKIEYDEDDVQNVETK